MDPTRAPRHARGRARAAVVAGLVLGAALLPAGTATAATTPGPGPWTGDGPTRTVMDSVTPIGTGPVALISQSADGVRRSADGGITWVAPSGLPDRAGTTFVSSTSLAVDGADAQRAWLVDSVAPMGSQPSAAARVAVAHTGAADAAANAAAAAATAAGTDDATTLFVTSDAGASWTAVAGDALAGRIVFGAAAVPMEDGDPAILLVDADAGILRSTDGGATFAPATDGIASDPEVGGIVIGGLAAGRAPGLAFASTTGGVWRTANGGASWTASCVASEALPCGRPFVAPGDPEVVLAAGFGGVARSGDGGRTWSRVGVGVLPGPDGGGIDTIAMSGDAPPVAWASGPQGVFRSPDGGRTWEAWDGGLAPAGAAVSDRLAIDPTAGARGWRIHGLTFHATHDGGQSWIELQGPDPVGLPAYAAIVGGSGTRLVGTDVGIQERAASGWRMVRADTIATDLVVGAHGGTEPSPGPGAEPSAATPSPPGLAPTAVYAATYAAGILVSADGGETWDDWSRGLPRAPAWTVLASASLGDRVLAATDAGAYERSEGAPSWAPLGTGLPDAAVRSLAVLPDGSILAGLETRGVWRLGRGLDEWRPAGLDGRTIVSIAIAGSDGRGLLAATDSHGLFRSPDAGRSWRKVASTRSTASVAYDAVTHTAILATGQAVLASIDGGRTWRAAASGLQATDPGRPWARAATRVTALEDGGFVLTTLGGTFVARPGSAP